MNWLAWTLIGLGILAVLLLATGWWRYVLTGYLIARVTPYEQPGGGSGSILVIGDSTGYGTGASQSEDSVAGRLGNDYTWYTITNNSVNGRTITEALTVTRDLSEDDRYNLVLLQIGANDMLQGASAEKTVERMRSLVEAIRPHADQIVIMTSGNIGGTPIYIGAEAEQYTDTSRTYDQLMRSLEQEYQDVAFVSLFDEPEDDLFVADPGQYTSIDGLHPSNAGYGVWYEKALPAFRQILNEK